MISMIKSYIKDLVGRLNDASDNKHGKKLIYKLDYILRGLKLIGTDKYEINLRKK